MSAPPPEGLSELTEAKRPSVGSSSTLSEEREVMVAVPAVAEPVGLLGGQGTGLRAAGGANAGGLPVYGIALEELTR
jgi:NAD kinase